MHPSLTSIRARWVLLFFACIFSVSAGAHTWDWARTAGNYGPVTNTWGYVTNNGLAQDNAGNIIIYGEFYDSLRLNDTFIVTRAGASHVKCLFLIKMNPAGERLWVRTYKSAEGAWAGSNASGV